jgi:hypothetical protein
VSDGTRPAGGTATELELSFDPADDRLSDVVVRAVAIATNSDPRRLAPLGHTVDPDALDAVFRPGGSVRSVEFGYGGYAVHVDAAGTIRLLDEE